MIVVTLSCCPPSLRGDLTKWMFEIDANVFVGRMSTRIRDQLWERIIKSCSDGRATMVYGVDNEQRFDFKVYNSTFTPIDFDGLRLMKKPLPNSKVSKKLDLD